jgi:hypothetical protein
MDMDCETAIRAAQQSENSFQYYEANRPKNQTEQTPQTKTEGRENIPYPEPIMSTHTITETAPDPRILIGTITDKAKLTERPDCAGKQVSNLIDQDYYPNRERINAVMNTAATNTIDASLKRVAVLRETVRAFSTRLLPLRLFSSVFQDAPLQGTDTIAIPYYPLQTATSSDFSDGDGTSNTGYQFGQATSTNKALITVNKRKYQPLDYSSREFRFQPWFDAVRLGGINAEKLGVDIINDVLSIVTNANFGAPIKTAQAAAFLSDDVADLRQACNLASWPDAGRSLLVDSTVDGALMKDPSYKLALNMGTPSVIQGGKFPNLSGFDYAWMPNLPTNGEKLIGFCAFNSAILSAFCPVDPAPGVRAQLVAYDVVTDPESGISFNYRHWGLAQADRDFEVIECCYGYQAGVAAAIKRICSP